MLSINFTVGIYHAVGIAVVGCYAQDGVGHARGCIIHSAHAAVNSLDSLYRSVEHAGVSDHVAVCKVADYHLVLIALYRLNAFVGDLLGAHLRDEVIGRELLG